MDKAKTTLSVIFVLSIVAILISVIVIAKPNSKANVPSFVPADAVQVSENVFSLGKAKDVDGRVVEGFLFIDNKKENAKPPWAGGDNGGGKCFDTFAKGASWKATEPYVTGAGIDLTLTETSLETWDSEVSFNIFGTGATGTTDGADLVSPDGQNEVEFENLGATNTIAYTVVWGIFSGPPFLRKLVEWDAVFNTAYTFGDAGPTDENNVGDTSVMDYQNIATHEFGHALGLGHPDGCTEETMYAFASFGETKKRTLNTGDIAGINELY